MSGRTHPHRRMPITVCAACTLLLSVPATPAGALEGLPAYPAGVGTLYDAAYPKQPGLYAYTYNIYYSADSFKDTDGNEKFESFDFDLGASAIRPIVVWDTRILGARPVSWAVTSVHYFDGSGSVLAPASGGGVQEVGFGNDRFGIGDTSIAQVLNWRLENWSIAAGLEIYTPTGEFDEDDSFNVGTNVFTFYPQVSATYRDADNNHVGAKLYYGISTENPDTNYQSGDHLILEGAAGIGITDRIGLDLTGFALLQTSDDEAPGTTLPDGGRSRLFGVGPQLRYNVGGGAISVKGQYEFGARNSPEGVRVWLQFGVPITTF